MYGCSLTALLVGTVLEVSFDRPVAKTGNSCTSVVQCEL